MTKEQEATSAPPTQTTKRRSNGAIWLKVGLAVGIGAIVGLLSFSTINQLIILDNHSKITNNQDTIISNQEKVADTYSVITSNQEKITDNQANLRSRLVNIASTLSQVSSNQDLYNERRIDGQNIVIEVIVERINSIFDTLRDHHILLCKEARGLLRADTCDAGPVE